MINSEKQKTKNLVEYFQILNQYNTVGKTSKLATSASPQENLQRQFSSVPLGAVRSSTVPCSSNTGGRGQALSPFSLKKATGRDRRTKKNLRMRSIPLKKNESVIECRKKHSSEIQKNAHYYYYILCRRQIQLSPDIKLNKKHLLTSGEIEQKASHSFKNKDKDSMEKKFGLSQTTKPVTSLMWTLFNKNSNKSITFEERETYEKKNVVKEKNQRFPHLKLDAKIQTGAVPTNLKTLSYEALVGFAPSFFPYRKSFLCYWLLPFVGFVSSATLPLNPKSTVAVFKENSEAGGNFVSAAEEKNFALFNKNQESNSYKNGESQFNDFVNVNVFSPQMPLKKKEKNLNTNEYLTDFFLFNSCSAKETALRAVSFPDSPGLEKNGIVREKTSHEKAEGSHTFDHFLKIPFVSPFSLQPEIGSGLDSNKKSISNSYKYCLYYLECLEKTLNKDIGAKETALRAVSSPDSPVFFEEQHGGKVNTGLNSSNVLLKGNLAYKDGNIEKLKSNTGFYLTSFFNRMLLAKDGCGGKFLNSLERVNKIEPLKIHLNVPSTYLYETNSEKKPVGSPVVKPKVSRDSLFFGEKNGTVAFFEEKGETPVFFSEKHGTVVKQKVSRDSLFSSLKNTGLFSKKTASLAETKFPQHLRVVEENAESSKKIIDFLRHDLKNLDTHLTKTTPVTSFLRASKLLDKYMVYQPVLSLLKNEKQDLNSDIHSRFVNKLFSYYSNPFFAENNLESLKVGSPTGRSATLFNLSKLPVSARKGKVPNDGSGAKETARRAVSSPDRASHDRASNDTAFESIKPIQVDSLYMLFKKISSFDHKKSKDWWNSGSDAGTWENIQSLLENSQKMKSLLSHGPTANKSHKELEFNNKLHSDQNNYVLDKILHQLCKDLHKLGKDKLYKLILVDLAENLIGGSTSPHLSSQARTSNFDESPQSGVQLNNVYFIDTSGKKEKKSLETVAGLKENGESIQSLGFSTVPCFSDKNTGGGGQALSSFSSKKATGSLVQFKHPLFMSNHIAYPGKVISFNTKDALLDSNELNTIRTSQTNLRGPEKHGTVEKPKVSRDTLCSSNTAPVFDGEKKNSSFNKPSLQKIIQSNMEQRTLISQKKNESEVQNPFSVGFSIQQIKKNLKKYTSYLLSPVALLEEKGETPVFFPEKHGTVVKPKVSRDSPCSKNTVTSGLSTSALKDFLLFNQINSHLKPIHREFYMKNSFFHIKNENLVRNQRPEAPFIPPGQKQKSDGLRTKKKFFVLNIPRRIEKSVQKTSQYEKKKDLNESNQKVFFTDEISFHLSQKHQSDKKAKLLRTYFSIKKASNLKQSSKARQPLCFSPKNTVSLVKPSVSRQGFGQKFFSKSTSLQVPTVTDKKRISSILDTSSKLKQKITMNLMSKSLLLTGFSPKQVHEPNELTKNALINGLNEKKIKSLNSSSVAFLKENGESLETRGFSIKNTKNTKNTKRLGNQFNLSTFETLAGFTQQQNKMKEVETRIISPRLLVNNRLLMNFSTVPLSKKTATVDFNLKNMNEPNEKILRKRKSIQKKRRLTKLRKQTRRRKKRMRFYPRPLWLRYRFYSQFLKNRHHTQPIFPLNNLIQHESPFGWKTASLEKPLVSRQRKKPLERKMLNSRHFSMNSLSCFPYHAGNAYIDLSSTVMGELKTAFWKSYWLRSNLKPYLNRMKTSLRDMKESSPQTSVQSLVTLFPFSSLSQLPENQTRQGVQFRSNFFVGSPTASKKIDSYYKTAHYLAEYNKIAEQRIRQFVSQIRENLTLNGNAKVRPSRILFQFAPNNRTSKMKGIYFLKRPTLRYDALSRLRLYWALSKESSSLVSPGPIGYPPTSTNHFNPYVYNKRRQLWTTEKYRRQTKEVKTKKIENDFKKNLQSFLNHTPYFMLQDRSSLTNAMVQSPVAFFEEKGETPVFFTEKNGTVVKPKVSPEGSPPFSKKTGTVGGINGPSGRLFRTTLLKSLQKTRRQNEKLYSLSFVHNKQNNFSMPLIQSPVAFFEKKHGTVGGINGPKGRFFRTTSNKKQLLTSYNENDNLRQLKIRHNRLKNSLTGTAKTHPFISGKRNYWWLQFKPTNMNGLGSSISNSMNSTPCFSLKNTGVSLSIQNIFGQNSFSSGYNNKEIQKSLVRSNNNTDMNLSTIHQQSNESILHINTLLFHFCSLITLLSLSQIRGLLKFTFIGLNKVFTLFERLTPSCLYQPFFSQVSAAKKIWPNFLEQQTQVDSRRNKQSLNRLDAYPLFGGNKVTSDFIGALGERKRNLGENRPSTDRFFKVPFSFQTAKEKVFDLNKRNDSFLYFFYATPFNQNLVSSSISVPYPRVFQSKTRGQNSLIQSFFKTSLKGSSSQQLSDPIEQEKLTKLAVLGENGEFSPGNKVSGTKGSRQLISTFNLRFLLTEGQFGLTDQFQNKSMGLNTNMTSYITGFYSLLNFALKKPIVFFKKWFLRLTTAQVDTQSISRISKSTLNSFEKNQPIPIDAPAAELNNNVLSGFQQSLARLDTSAKGILLLKNKILLYSFFGLKQILDSSLQIFQKFSTLLGLRAQLDNGFRSIYMFFEKPGVLIVDWVAYLFLVEWASDITTTLPENVDTQIVGSPFHKLTRTIYSVSPLLPGSQLIVHSTLFRSFAIGTSSLNSDMNMNMNMTSGLWSSGLVSQITFFNLASTFLKRRMYDLYEILVLQFYQPDTDLLVRQKKSMVFWDIWGDFLTQTAEDSNLNISELSSLKEEQIKLLENASLEMKVPVFFEEKQGESRQTEGLTTDKFNLQKKRMYSKKTSLSSRTRFQNQIYSQKMGSRSTFSNISSFQSISGINSFSSSFLGIPLQPRSQKQKNRLHQWGSQQFLSYAMKSKDTELFIELHPPRALSNLLKKKESSQQFRSISPLGSLVCQIFSGILTQQISKNILIIGNSSPKSLKKENSSSENESTLSLEKTLLVQAIAGETELKMITDNASRYALVYRGVAVGIKLLREVFDSLSLQTPCFFLLEDIHAIGERRPFLISDDSPETEQYVEVHDKNQVLYELSKHVMSHYKKPYRGDYSLSIPTNYFCFDFFKGRTSTTSKIGKVGSLTGIPTTASLSRQNTVSPRIPYTEVSNGEQKKKGITKVLKSRLNRLSVELFSPPATSPFSILTLKEEKKFKPRKKVSDLSWSRKTSGISQADNTGSQTSQKTGPAYSIRSKVALLADMAISSLSVKLDMITDLLVIIDSVRGNRGFVVFATTHIPFVLDPALRRPGRLDETIHFGFSSKNHPLEISRLGILNVPSSRTFESSHHSVLIGQTMRSPLALGKKPGGSLDLSLSSIDIDIHTLLARLSKSGAKPDKASHYTLQIDSSQKTVPDPRVFQRKTRGYSKRTSSLFSSFSNSLFQPNLSKNLTQLSQSLLSVTPQSSSSTFGNEMLTPKQLIPVFLSEKHGGRDNSCLNYPKTSQILSQVATKASSYFNVSLRFFTPRISRTKTRDSAWFSKKTTQTVAFFNEKGETPVFTENEKRPEGSFISTNQIQSLSSFESTYVEENLRFSSRSPRFLQKRGDEQKIQLSPHYSSQQYHFDLCLNNELSQFSNFSTQNTFINSSHLSLYGSPHIFKKNISFLISSKIGEFLLFSKNSKLEPIISSEINHIMTGFSVGVSNQQKNNLTRIQRRISLMPILNESISSLVFSFVQKRFLYKKNLLLPSLFNLTNYSSLLEPPSPPISSVLLPAKRYENLRRSLFYYQNNDQNFGGGISEKINIHQQQRLIRRLYNLPVKESSRSEMIENRFSGFSKASLMIGSISPSHLQKTSTSNWFVRNRILTRHSHYLTNQWWTGQLPEQNSETTFLSDIDWRCTFLAADTFGEKEARDILLDFPDADQHYNPRNRRWVGNLKSSGIVGTIGIHSLTSSLSSGSSTESKFPQDSSVSTQTTTDNSIFTEIYTHFIYDSFLKAFNIYEQNREVFDYYVFYICKQGLHSNLNEFERLKLIQRFMNF